MEASWIKMVKQADDYYGTVYRLSQTKRFRNDTLYTIICLSTQKLLLSYLLSLGETPFNQSLSSLVRDMKPNLRNSAHSLYVELQFLETFQHSSVNQWQRPIPTDADMQRMVQTLVAIHTWVTAETNKMCS